MKKLLFLSLILTSQVMAGIRCNAIQSSGYDGSTVDIQFYGLGTYNGRLIYSLEFGPSYQCEFLDGRHSVRQTRVALFQSFSASAYCQYLRVVEKAEFYIHNNDRTGDDRWYGHFKIGPKIIPLTCTALSLPDLN